MLSFSYGDFLLHFPSQHQINVNLPSTILIPLRRPSPLEQSLGAREKLLKTKDFAFPRPKTITSTETTKQLKKRHHRYVPHNDQDSGAELHSLFKVTNTLGIAYESDEYVFSPSHQTPKCTLLAVFVQNVCKNYAFIDVTPVVPIYAVWHVPLTKTKKMLISNADYSIPQPRKC